MTDELLSKRLFDISESMYDEGLYQWSDEIEKQAKTAEAIERDFAETLKLTQTLIAGISWFNVEKEQDRFYQILEKWEKTLGVDKI